MSGVGPIVVRAAQVMREAEEAEQRIAAAYETVDPSSSDSGTVTKGDTE